MTTDNAITWLYEDDWAEKFNPNHGADGKFSSSDSAVQALSDHMQAHKELKEHSAHVADMSARFAKAQEYWKGIGKIQGTEQDKAQMKGHEERGKQLQENYDKTRAALKPHADFLIALGQNLKKN